MTEERHGCAGALRALGGVGAKSGPPSSVLPSFPKKLSIVLTGWPKSIQDKPDAEDAPTIVLCHKYGVIEEGAPATFPEIDTRPAFATATPQLCRRCWCHRGWVIRFWSISTVEATPWP